MPPVLINHSCCADCLQAQWEWMCARRWLASSEQGAVVESGGPQVSSSIRGPTPHPIHKHLIAVRRGEDLFAPLSHGNASMSLA